MHTEIDPRQEYQDFPPERGSDPADMAGPRGYAACKTAVELILALVLLVGVAPLVLLVAVLVKLSSRGPVFYRQARLGRQGRPFQIWKVRTMVHRCEDQTGPQWAKPVDPRITPVGRFLRASHLDELPQLWNVLRGEMSLIGPRPERPEFVGVLERSLPDYRRRLLVRPGVTGLAQVQLPPDTSVGSVRRKLAYDLYYVQRMGPWLDLRILLGTALKVFGVPFPVLRSLLGMPSEAAVARAYPRATAPEPRSVRQLQSA